MNIIKKFLFKMSDILLKLMRYGRVTEEDEEEYELKSFFCTALCVVN